MLAYVQHKRQLLLKQEKPIHRQLLLDTLGTAVIFVSAAAAIVVGGSVVMFMANALPKSNPMHFWLVPLVAIPYWITVVVAALWAWGTWSERLNNTGSLHSAKEKQGG
jgi:hypothetical protein